MRKCLLLFRLRIALIWQHWSLNRHQMVNKLLDFQLCFQLLIANNYFSILAIDTKSACQNCETTIENWICLTCFKTFCSRYVNEHMLFHHLEQEDAHALALSFSDLSVWCFKCENYIDNPILFKYKNLAHRDKFGEEMVWCYDTQPILLES